HPELVEGCASAASESAAVATSDSAAVRSGRGIDPPLTDSLTNRRPRDGSPKRAALLSGGGREHGFLTLAGANVDHFRGLSDLQHVERVRVVVNICDRLSGNLDDDIAFLQTGLLGGTAADDAAQQQSFDVGRVVGN